MFKTKNLMPKVMLVLFLFLCFQNPLDCTEWGNCMDQPPVCQAVKGCLADQVIPGYCEFDCYGGGAHEKVICPMKII